MAGETAPIVTSLGKADLDKITVRGFDLCQDIVGKIGFADMTFLMLVGRLPSADQARMTDALLNVLVEHGMVSGVIASRLIYHTAPEAIQGAVAVSLLGAGSVHLGSSEYSARMLVEALPPSDEQDDLKAVAERIVARHAQEKKRIAGIGHRTHAEGDPRAERLLEVARETGVYGRYCELIQHVSQVAETHSGRRLPVNVTGAIAAIALDLGLPWQMAKAFALIGRTLGAVAHVAEEIRNPMAANIDAAIKAALVYEQES